LRSVSVNRSPPRAIHSRGESITTRTRGVGAALIFERLWQETGIRAVLQAMLCERRFEFALERGRPSTGADTLIDFLRPLVERMQQGRST